MRGVAEAARRRAGQDVFREPDTVLIAAPPAPGRRFDKTLDLETPLTLADTIIADEDVVEGPEARPVYDAMPAGA